MKTKFNLCAALLLAVIGANANANVDVATPFGVAMGVPGSCAAIDKRLKTLDPTILRMSAGGGGEETQGASSYAPVEKVFPGARQNMIVFCQGERLQLIAFSVSKGAYNSILLDVLSQLGSKYQKRHSTSIDLILKNGGDVNFYVGQSSVTVSVSGTKEFFSLRYEYTGPMTNEAIDATNKQNAEAMIRRGVL